MNWNNRIFRKEAQKYRTWNSPSARLRMRLTFSTIIRIRYRDVFRPFHLFSWTNVVLTFKYYTNLRLQLLVFGMWSIRSSCWNTGGGGGGISSPLGRFESDISELKQRGRWQKRLLKSEFTLFRNSLLLFHVVQLIKCCWIFLTLNSEA